MNESVIQAMEEYYKIKQAYDEQISKAKRKIIRDKSKDKQQKRQELAAIKTKCVNCGKVGKMIFSNNNNVLKAQCGVVGDACSLNIEINTGDYDTLPAVGSFVRGELQDLTTEIIRTKLDMLFSFIPEQEAFTTFTEKKGEYDELSGNLREIDEQFDSMIRNTRNKAAINEKNADIFVLVERLKQLIDQFKEDENPSLIDEAIGLYNSEINPAAKQLRELMYKKNTIECSSGETGPTLCDDDIYYLIQAPYTYDEMQYSLETPAVISNVK
jgi:hypothetical protein